MICRRAGVDISAIGARNSFPGNAFICIFLIFFIAGFFYISSKKLFYFTITIRMYLQTTLRSWEMSIDTTIYINSILFRRLSEAEKISGQTKSQIVSSLLRRLADDHTAMLVSWSRVRYQKRDAEKNWRRFHLHLRQDEYEFFLDLRKFFKRSVSNLIAYALSRHLNELMRKIKESPDNYQYRNYILSQIIIDNVICWILYWGVPKRIITCPQEE